MRKRSIWFHLAAIISIAVFIAGSGIAQAFLSFNDNSTYPPSIGAPYTPGPGDPYPDYLTTPNWANSPQLRKFVDDLPGLCDPRVADCDTLNNGINIPIAVPDIVTYPGSDYYVIELRQFEQQMHSDLPNPTTLRGYLQANSGTDTSGGCKDPAIDPNDPGNCTILQNTIVPSSSPHYLGPVIIAKKDRPVRVLFRNMIDPGNDGDLFLPVDGTVIGSGPYTINYDPVTKDLIPETSGLFSTNRATLHLHGGRNPWISDGTPHQWITPANEDPTYPQGVSVENVPDMPLPLRDSGEQTFYWTNQQSSRLMFYHDHAWGITRLNVYAGEAAGYVITDDVESALISGGTVTVPGVGSRTFTAGTIPGPADTIPLVIQDKTFVDDNPASPTYIYKTDPTWNWGVNGGGDLWWPHVYMPAQNPFDITGIAPLGRWAYGPYFWPATNNPFQPIDNPYYNPDCDPSYDPTPGDGLTPADIAWNEANISGYTTINGAPFCQTIQIPSTPNPSWGAEAFMDTMVVNGMAYPKVTVERKPYRLRILNAAHDRFLNLSLFKADTLRDANADPASTDACAAAGGCALNTEVRMIDASATALADDPACASRPSWPADGRAGGVPACSDAGPDWIMIGNEGGFLPMPVVIPPHPVTWNTDVTTFNAGNVNGGSLILGPAERADVIVDFSTVPDGTTLILYNDAPAPWPALDPHYDYYTDAPDSTDMGGAPPIIPGFGPNIRTVMQITVSGGSGTAFNMSNLVNAFTSTKNHGGTPGVFQLGQDPLIVAQGNMNPTGDPAYYEAFLFDQPYNILNKAYDSNFPSIYPNWGISQINSKALWFKGVDGSTTYLYNSGNTSTHPLDPSIRTYGGIPLGFKAIQDEQGETFDDYGRMRAALGIENITPGAGRVNFIVQTFSDPTTEANLAPDQIQIWKITHNGVDTHPIHFHLFDVQVINRVGWDGFIRLPDPTELGWKETVRISPLEDTIVALKPKAPLLPFGLPTSYRPKNPAVPVWSGEGNPDPVAQQIYYTELTQVDPITGNPRVNFNQFGDFGWEYVWHCHILSHEENDMMRPIVFNVTTTVPAAPSLSLLAIIAGPAVNLEWTDPTPAATSLGNPANEIFFRIDREVNGGGFVFLADVGANTTTYQDTTVTGGNTYRYIVTAVNASGETSSLAVTASLVPPDAPTGLNATVVNTNRVDLGWNDNSGNEDGFIVERSVNGGDFAFLGSVGAGVTAYSDTTVTAGNTYSYRVYAYNGFGNSAPTNTATVTPLGIPSSLTVPAGSSNGNIALAWGFSSTTGVTYVVEESMVADFSVLTPASPVYTGTARNVNLTGKANGTYYYRVKATMAGSIDSGWRNGTNPCVVNVIVDTPSSFTVPAGSSNGNIALAWGTSSTAGVTYVVEESMVSDFSVLTPASPVYTGTARTVTLTGKANGTYWYRVKATRTGWTDSAYRNGSNSCTVAVTLAAPTYFTVPANSSGNIQLTWGPSSMTGVTFVVEESMFSDFSVLTLASPVYTGTAQSTTLTGRTTGTYYYRVKATKSGWTESVWKNGSNGCVIP
ncbi:MAG: choice-of-anchor D domain-containing protein [Thermodesulfovibrionales bacterium]